MPSITVNRPISNLKKSVLLKNTTKQTFVVLQILLESKIKLIENNSFSSFNKPNPEFIIQNNQCHQNEWEKQPRHHFTFQLTPLAEPEVDTSEQAPKIHSVYTFREVILGAVSAYYPGIAESMLAERKLAASSREETLNLAKQQNCNKV